MNEEFSPINQPDSKPGPFLATVVSHLDPSYMGGLEVEILRSSGGSTSEGQLHQVKYMSPFYGITKSNEDIKDQNQNTFTNSQQSYGMWFVPPDVGSTVVVMFIDGDPKRGYWIGCVQDENMNFMLPGAAATKQAVGGRGEARVPTGEYNKALNNTVGDPDQIKKPKHPLADILEAQGLLADDTRGITTSSARRETPSAVFGISTPGPLDKRTGARQGPVGKSEHRVTNAYLSRLGGTTFVMDDGDDKYLRKTKASDGPPVYASVEAGEKGGDPTIPHNELFRIRTRTGHQILLHNSEDLIYIGNSRGTAWIELTSNGKIDIYAGDDITMHTEGNFNIKADGNINFNAGGDFNVTAGGVLNLKPGGAANINPGGNCNILAAGTSIDGGDINLNSGVATGATIAALSRWPTHEPWAGHENLHGQALKYSTSTDTFMKDKGATK